MTPEQRALRLPRVCDDGGNHALHTLCGLDFLAPFPAPAPICYPMQGCGGQHEHGLVLENIIREDLDTRSRAVGLGGVSVEVGTKSRPRRHNNGWTQDSLGMGAALDMFSVEKLSKRFHTVVAISAALQSMFSRLFLHVLYLLNFESGQHVPPGGESPRSLLRAVKLFHLRPALPFSAKGQIPCYDEGRDLGTTALAHGVHQRRNGCRRGASGAGPLQNTAFEKGSAACRHKGGVSTAARAL